MLNAKRLTNLLPPNAGLCKNVMKNSGLSDSKSQNLWWMSVSPRIHPDFSLWSLFGLSLVSRNPRQQRETKEVALGGCRVFSTKDRNGSPVQEVTLLNN
jgi:hypothetical protein